MGASTHKMPVQPVVHFKCPSRNEPVTWPAQVKSKELKTYHIVSEEECVQFEMYDGVDAVCWHGIYWFHAKAGTCANHQKYGWNIKSNKTDTVQGYLGHDNFSVPA